MPSYTILSMTPMNGKTGMEVTFIDELNGKPDVTQYHEVESTDDTVIEDELAEAALEYEARIPPVIVASKLALRTAVKAARRAARAAEKAADPVPVG
jgi:hypothetical protein